MELDKITITMRPRSHREAMDLGLKLLQCNWRALYRPWLLLIFPLFFLLNILFSSHMWIAALIIWWLKPLYDRILLFVLSRSLFSDVPTTRQTLAAIPNLFKNGLIWQLTLLRLSPSRSFTMPVWILEGLRGSARRQRIQVLQNRTSGYAIGLLILCWHLELIMLFSFYILILMFLPQNFEFGSLFSLFSESPGFWLELVVNFLYLLAILIIEPFYVAAGFMLYINRRNQLEAWDIEIQFRRIAQRLAQFTGKTAVLMASLFLITVISLPATKCFADEPSAKTLTPDESKRVIEEVLQDKAFGTEREISYWQLKNLETDDEEDSFTFNFGLAPLLASILKLILVALLLGFIIFILLKARHLTISNRSKNTLANDSPNVLFGMKITPESLPADVTAMAIQLWSRKHFREAIALLYRASLSYLVNEDHIILNSAMTEQDVLDHAQTAKLDEARINFLSKLTLAWQSLAYAHRLPDEPEIQLLFKQWPIHFVRRPS